MKNPLQHNSKRILFYLWTGFAFMLLIAFHEMSTFKVSFWTALINNIWRTSYVGFINFLFFEFFLSFIWRKRSYILYNIVIGVIGLWVFIMFWSYGLFLWRDTGIIIGIYMPLGSQGSKKLLLEAQMGFSAGSLFFFGIIRHIYNHVRLQHRTQQLDLEKKQAQLNYLKSQTNPHFLFNTLNNIYALVKSNNKLALESILRLSKILRFMLYETGGNYISIQKEIEIIEDYIQLEKLRYDGSLKINFDFQVENEDECIPPLLLVPLVENAFKHGVSETRDEPFIDIHLWVRGGQLYFMVKNSTEAVEDDLVINENIGLSNISRQLELLYKEYNLTVEPGKSVFTVGLKINLFSHVKDPIHENMR